MVEKVQGTGEKGRSNFSFGVLLTMCLTMAALVLPVAPAAAATCSGSSCNGRDPQSTGCSSGATDVAGTAMWFNSFSVVMRNSGACGSRWTRITVDDYLPTCCLAIRVRLERQIWTPYGYYTTHNYTKRVGAGVEGQYWTVMAQNTSDDRHRSCYRFEAADGSSPGAWSCSGWK